MESELFGFCARRGAATHADERRRQEHVQAALLGLEREVAGEERREGADDVARDTEELDLDGGLAGVDGTNDSRKL